MSKKERYCIKNGKLYDRDTCVGYISEYQDETYVDMLNCLDEQLTEGAQHTEIQNLRKQLTEKDKEIEELKLEAMRWEEHFNNARMDYQCLEEDKNKEIAKLRKQLTDKDKELKQKNKTIKKYIHYNDELANALVEKPEQEELYQLREDNKVLSMNRDNYVNAKLKEQRHQICEEIKIAMTSIEPNCSIEDMNSDLYEFTGRDIYAILDTVEQAKR